LSSGEVKRLALESLDADGANLRTCISSDEGADKDWTDINGNDCAWYQKTRKTKPNICSTSEIQNNCPLACDSKPVCYEGDKPPPSVYTIWSRIMYLSEENKGGGLICVLEGVDAVAECRKHKANPTSTIIPGAQDWLKYSSLVEHKPYMDIKLEDCDVLERHIDPYCSFSAPWTRMINTQIKTYNGYSVDFWWKALEETKIARTEVHYKEDPELMRRIVFFSKLSPPTVLAEMVIADSVGYNVYLYGACSVVEREQTAFTSPIKHENGVWYRTAFTLGNMNDDGKRGVHLYHGSSVSFDFADWSWCRDETMDFIQGMQLPGGILISPIEVTSSPLSVKEMQQRYYSNQVSVRLRRGAVMDDKTRMTDTIPYERNTYAFPVSLVSPPILLQTRVEKTDVCTNELGTIYQKQVWKGSIEGVGCESPYGLSLSLSVPLSLVLFFLLFFFLF